MQKEYNPVASGKVLVAGGVWLVLALVFGASGAQAKLAMPFPQVLLFALTAALLLVFWKASVFRDWAMGVELNHLLRFHVVRLVGFYFLYLHSRGDLPYAFAVPGGIGDIVVALAALVVMSAPATMEGKHKIYRTWNILGLVDIMFVVFTAGRLGLANPDSMRALTKLPLALLPSFIVPIIIATHILILVRLRKMKMATTTV